MKKVLVYIILFSYSLMLVRPTVPVFADIIAHTFWYSQHIATVHFENGKYHVHYQYMNEAQKSFPGKNPHNIKTENSISDHIVMSDRFDILFHFITNTVFQELPSFIPEIFLQQNFPPPKI